MHSFANIRRSLIGFRIVRGALLAVACAVVFACSAPASAFAYDRIDGTIASGSMNIGIGFIDSAPQSSAGGGSAVDVISGEGSMAIGINLRDTSAGEPEPTPELPGNNTQYVGLISGEVTMPIGLIAYDSTPDEITDPPKPVGAQTGTAESVIGINLRDTSPSGVEGDAPSLVGSQTGEGTSVIGINLRDTSVGEREPTPELPGDNTQYVGLLSGEATVQVGLMAYDSTSEDLKEPPTLVDTQTGEGTSVIGINLRDTSVGEPEPTPELPGDNTQYVGLLSGEATVQVGLLAYNSTPEYEEKDVVNFVLDGGTINNGYFRTYTPGVEKPLPTDVSKPGYSFIGWFDTPDFDVTTDTPITAIPTTATGTLTYYAAWDLNAVDIKWHANGGAFTVETGVDDVHLIEDGLVSASYAIGAPLAGIEQTDGVSLLRQGGWIHTGWCTELDENGDAVEGTEVDLSSGSVLVDPDVLDYYATWEKAISVTVPTYVDLKMRINANGVTVESERDYQISSLNWPVDIVDVKAWDADAITGTMTPDATDPDIAEAPDSASYQAMLEDNAQALFANGSWRDVNLAISGTALMLTTSETGTGSSATKVTTVVPPTSGDLFLYNLGTRSTVLADEDADAPRISVATDVTEAGATQKKYSTRVYYSLDNIDLADARRVSAEDYDGKDIAHIMYVVQIG